MVFVAARFQLGVGFYASAIPELNKAARVSRCTSSFEDSKFPPEQAKLF